MAENLSPFVFWGQNNDRIFLKVDLAEVSDPEVQIGEDTLTFKAYGVGVRGKNEYSLNVDFYLPVDPDESKYRVTGRHVEFQIKKVGCGENWPRLMEQPQKPAWLKIDFDHFHFEDEDSGPETGGDGEYKMSPEEEEMMKKIEHDMLDAKDNMFKDMRTFYLFIYNMFQWVGFSYVFIAMCGRYWMYGQDSKKDTFEAVGPQLMVCQLIALLEIIHPMLGWVRTGVLMPLLQVFGRNLILFGVLMNEPNIQDRGIVWWLFLTWSSVELVRYPFYMLNTIQMEWKFVTWLRYTIWIPLYPLGFFCEGFVMLVSLPHYDTSGKLSLTLPNSLNFAFHFPTFLRIYMCAFLIGGYFLMKQMYQQRKKKLGISTPPSKRPKSKTKKS